MARRRSAAGRGAWVVVALTLGAGDCFAEAQPPVVPLPAEFAPGEGSFRVGSRTVVRVPRGDADAENAARYFVQLLERSRGLKLAVRRDDASAPRAITFARQAGFAAEGYALDVSPEGARITATSGAGLLYGAATLWQLLPVGKGAAEIPSQTIRDAPAYAWRGLMLDSARHFQSPAFVKSMIDWMALHKLNVLHWHLTDDQGWRIEIRKYPRLTDIGASRTPATAGNKKAPVYTGYYTQAEIREIVAHAASRHVQVIPEIEMPGHAQAAVAAYPALGAVTKGSVPAVSASWGVHEYLFNLEPQTFTFLEDVLGEVMALFPSPYIHVGGDEAVKDQWKTSPEVQARARALGISDPEALQTWFTQEIGRFLERHGRRLVGWDEILRPGLPTQAIVMSWQGTTGARHAAIAGNDTVLSPWPTLYFDNQQSALASEPPGRMRVISLEDVYRFELRDPALTEAQQSHVLGVQGNLWTEHIRTEDRLEWMALPRAAAVAEVGWTARDRRQWPEFVQRLVPLFEHYQALGLHYADSVFAIDARASMDSGGVRATLANQSSFGEIHYTTNGRDPSTKSPKYTAPLNLPLGTNLRAATFVDGKPVSRILHRKLDAASLSRRGSRELDLCSDGVSLLLEPNGNAAGERPIFALDIMNPCWIYRGVDLSRGAQLTASVGQLPFNFEIGAEAQKIRVGNSRGSEGELEVRVGGCESPVQATQAVAPIPSNAWTNTLPPITLLAQPGRHDVCVRFARPRLDPMWVLHWLEIKP
jgi:hexosaminidase